MRKIIIDTDPGIDDAVALANALFDEQLDVVLITTVAGNVSAEKTTENTLKLLTFFGKEHIPVAAGSNKPLMVELDDASDVHGHSGLDGYTFEKPTIKPLEINAVEAMKNALLSSDEPITLVPIGPLTNIALLLSLYPEVKPKIESIVFMGGSTARGNKTPMAEFNIYVDPEAAKIVLHSGLKIVMCGLDLGIKAMIYDADCLKIKNQNKTGDMLYSLFSHYRGGSLKTGLKMYDSTAIGYLLNPSMYTTVDCFVDIETKSELTYGCSVVDLRGYFKKPANVTVCTDIDVDAFTQWLIQSLSKAI